jgi:YHS domain-containing protein
MHAGQKYYVCCTGCLDYFKENPDEVIAEYKARKEEARKEAEKAKEN